MTGKIKWFNPHKGYGFIKCDDGGPEVFIHANELPDGRATLVSDQAVAFDLGQDRRGRAHARHVKIISP